VLAVKEELHALPKFTHAASNIPFKACLERRSLFSAGAPGMDEDVVRLSPRLLEIGAPIGLRCAVWRMRVSRSARPDKATAVDSKIDSTRQERPNPRCCSRCKGNMRGAPCGY
jgi:hypothetical protein